MPKETIHDGAEMYDVTVGWSPDSPDSGGHVQVGVTTHDGRSLAAMLAPDLVNLSADLGEAEKAHLACRRVEEFLAALQRTDVEFRTALDEWMPDGAGNRVLMRVVSDDKGAVPLYSNDLAALTSRQACGEAEWAQFTGVWGTLDRAGCNRMIRALRRARDQAYGPDA